MINIIVAIAENGVIGGANSLLWHISEDLKSFKKITSGHPIIMGRKTYESIGRPLPGRDNVVITRQEIEIEGCIVVHSLEEAIAIYPSYKEIFIIGGGEIYRESLPLADRLYITRVHRDYEGDTYFPEIETKSWQLAKSERREGCEGFDFPFTFEQYRRCSTSNQNHYFGVATKDDIPTIREIAIVSFTETYESFISPEQVDYMMEWMYSEQNLLEQIENGFHFYLLYHNCVAVGYIALHAKANNVIYLERLYLLRSMQGLGLGNIMMRFIEEESKRLNGGSCRIELNVNRNNKSVEYYLHQGFSVAEQGDYVIEGTEFIRNDYIMSKEVK